MNAPLPLAPSLGLGRQMLTRHWSRNHFRFFFFILTLFSLSPKIMVKPER